MNPSLARSMLQNVYVMKERFYPSLDLERLRSLRVLIIGAGTLGCHISRHLLSYGISNITFVDNGTISLNNPLRQSLYRFEDIGKQKADIAPARLSEIFPEGNYQGFVFEIPMPDHPVLHLEIDQVWKEFCAFVRLVEESDIIFNCTDSKEARYFPTLIASILQKTIMSVGIGVDNFVITHTVTTPSKGRTGCYFCNDIYSASDNQSSLPENERCTSTRPGMASIASSYAVELMIDSFLNHSGPSILRGDINKYHIQKADTESFSCCIACSAEVQKQYQENPLLFIIRACNNGSSYLRRISGIDQMIQTLEDSILIDDEI